MHRDGNPNGYGIDGAETEPQQNFNSGNGHSYHSMTVIEKGNLEIMEAVERPNFYTISACQKWVEVVVVVQLCFFFVIMHVFYFCNIEKSASKF